MTVAWPELSRPSWPFVLQVLPDTVAPVIESSSRSMPSSPLPRHLLASRMLLAPVKRAMPSPPLSLHVLLASTLSLPVPKAPASAVSVAASTTVPEPRLPEQVFFDASAPPVRRCMPMPPLSSQLLLVITGASASTISPRSALSEQSFLEIVTADAVPFRRKIPTSFCRHVFFSTVTGGLAGAPSPLGGSTFTRRPRPTLSSQRFFDRVRPSPWAKMPSSPFCVQ